MHSREGATQDGKDHRVLHTEKFPAKRQMDLSEKTRENYRV